MRLRQVGAQVASRTLRQEKVFRLKLKLQVKQYDTMELNGSYDKIKGSYDKITLKGHVKLHDKRKRNGRKQLMRLRQDGAQISRPDCFRALGWVWDAKIGVAVGNCNVWERCRAFCGLRSTSCTVQERCRSVMWP